MMTKKILTRLLLTSLYILTYIYVNGQTKENKFNNNQSELNLVGKVRKITEIELSKIDTANIIFRGDMQLKRIFLFNEKGYKIEESAYWKSDTLFYKYKYKYDSNGNLIGNGSYKSDGSFYNKWVFIYDSLDNKIEEIHYNSLDSVVFKGNYKYNDKGKMINYIQMGQYFSIDSLKYDNNDNLIEKGCFSGGKLINKYVYKYNQKGNIIEEKCYNYSKRLDYKETFKYDDKNNLIEENSYNSKDSIIKKYIYKYNDEGKKIEYNYCYKLDGSKITYKYDNKENIIELNFYDIKDSLISKTTYQYEFDKIGNWIKKTEIINNKTQSDFIEREIEYQ